jgi:integrase
MQAEKEAGGHEAGKTLGQLTARFVDVRCHRWALSTVRRYEAYMSDLEEYFGIHTPIRAIKLDSVEDWQRHLRDGRNLSNGTINGIFELARSVFRYAAKLCWLEGNVFELVDDLPDEPIRRANPFTAEEVAKLIETARRDFALLFPAIVIAAVTGVRRAELCSFDCGDFEASTGILTLRAANSKTGRAQYFALPPQTRLVVAGLADGRDPDEPLLQTRSGHRMNPHSFDVYAVPPKQYPRAWRRLLDAAGVVPRGIHNLRSAVVTNLVEDGFTLDQAVAVTGQTPRVAREHYLRHRAVTKTSIMGHLEDSYLGDKGAGSEQRTSD